MKKFVDTVSIGWTGKRAAQVRLLPDVLPAGRLPPVAETATRVPFGISEDSLAPVYLDFGADAHFLIFGDTECGKSNLLRLISDGIAARYTPDEARLIFIDYRRSLLDAAGTEHNIGYAASSAAAGPLLNDVRDALTKRLPPPDLTPDQLRSRSWWSGSDLFMLIDDYDIVATSSNPLLPIVELLPQARDVGLHVILARSAGGAGRSMFDPVIQRIREMGSPGLVMSGSRDEGTLLGSVRPASQPCGRGFLVGRRNGSRLDPGRPARRGRPGGVALGAVPGHRPAVSCGPPPLGPTRAPVAAAAGRDRQGRRHDQDRQPGRARHDRHGDRPGGQVRRGRPGDPHPARGPGRLGAPPGVSRRAQPAWPASARRPARWPGARPSPPGPG